MKNANHQSLHSAESFGNQQTAESLVVFVMGCSSLYHCIYLPVNNSIYTCMFLYFYCFFPLSFYFNVTIHVKDAKHCISFYITMNLIMTVD